MDYSLLFRKHRAVTLLIDSDTGQIRDANDAAVQFYGYSYDEIISMHVEHIHVADDTADKRIWQNITDDQAFFEGRHRLVSGELKAVDIWSTQIDLADSTILHWIVLDATQRRHHKLSYRALFEQSNDAVFILDLTGRHLDVNQRATTMLGYSRQALLDMPAHKLVPDTDIEDSEKVLKQVLAGKKMPLYERNLRHQNGQLVSVEVNVELVLDEHGKPHHIQSIMRDISERKRAGHESQRYTERLRLILNGTRSGTWEWNVQSGETVFNERWAEIIGYTLDELEPISIQTWIDLTHPDDLQQSNQLLEKHFAGESTYYECEARMKHKDGHWVWVLDRGMVMEWTEEGKPLRMFGTHNDITQRKSMENQVKSSEERLRTIVDNIPIMISFFDEQGQFEFSNKHWNDRLGWTATELATEPDPLSKFYPDETYRQEVLDFMLKAEPGWREFRTQTKSQGTLITSWANVRLSDGRSIGIGKDVTERAQMEQELRLRDRALEASPYGVIIVDARQDDMPIVYTNPSFETITGYTSNYAIGKNCRFMQGDDRAQPELDKLRHALRNNEVCRIKLRNYKRDGTLFWNDLSIAPILDQAGTLTHFVGIQHDITALVESQDALKRSEARFRAMVDSMDDIIFTLDANQRHTGVYGKWLEKNQLSPESFVGHSARDMFGEEAARVHERANLSALSGENIRYEWQSQSAGGEAIFYQTHLSPIVEDDKIIGLVGVGRDITELENAKTALKRSEAYYRSVISALSEGIVVHEPDGAITTCNDAAQQILGLRYEQMMGRTPVDPRWRTIHEDSTPFPGDQHPAAITLKTGEAQHNVIMGVHKPDDDLAWILVSSEPILDPDSQEMIAVVASFTDITNQKKSERAIVEKNNELERFFSLVLDLMCIATPDGDLVKVNQAWETTLGYPVEILEHQSFMHLVHPDDLDQTQAALIQLSSGKSITNFINRYRHDDGSYRLLQWAAQQVGDLVYATARDITEQKRLEEQAFAYALEKERVEILTRFIRDASHEFRTPLSVIQSSLYILGKSTSPEKRQEKTITIQNQVARLTQLLESLVLMSKLDSGVAFEFHEDDLLSLLLNKLNELQPDILEKNLSVTVEATDNYIILVDTEYMQEAIKHVLHNAVRYTPTDGQIVVRFSVEKDVIMIDIENSSDGIPDEILPRIFERFYRHDEAHTTPGIGLGLSIARSVIERHGGTLEVENLVDHNVRFRITFQVE